MKPTVALTSIAALLCASCAIEDADLESTAAMTAIDLSASSDQVTSRLAQVTGTLTLGYTSSELVQIRILDNSVPVHVASIPADSLTIQIDETIELIDEGINELTVVADYNQQSIQQKLLVTVPGALQSFELTPAATAVNVFSVDVSGSATFGHLSDEPATLDILVGGASVYQESFDVSTELSASFQAAIPLPREGSNEIVGVLRYRGKELTRQLTVAAAMDAPTLEFPVWAPSYTPGEGITLAGNVVVTADAAYTIDGVYYSIDGGERLPAASLGNGEYGIALVDPDIGKSTVAVEVETSSDFHGRTTTFFDPIQVDPIFDCNSPATSMLPSNDLIRDQRNENRIMVGYFGDPDGAHDVSFVLSGNPLDGPIQAVGQTLVHGRTAMSVAFDVGELRCENAPCDLPYALAVFVDGQQLCSRTDFGVVTRY